MKRLLTLLALNKRWWVAPIVIYAVVVVWLASLSAEAPVETFDYRFN